MAFEITDNTPRNTITIVGKSFKVPEPFAEGHVLDANEAGVLNQTYAENIRNNLAAKISEMIEAAKKEGATPFDLDAAQTLVDDYCSDYQFGQRRGGSSGDPVERQALEDARELVRNKIREKGGKLSDYKAADITAKAKEVLERYPAIREQAKVKVEAEQAAAAKLAESLGSIDI